jgi:hypothetical protein
MSFGGGPGRGFGQGRRGGFSFSGAAGGVPFNGGQGGFPAGSGQRGASSNGQGGFAGAGPQGRFPFPGGTGGPASGRGGFAFGGGGGGGAGTFAGTQVPTLDPRLLRYLEQHQGTARYLVATTTSSYASLFILDTNQPAMALGGYQGWDRILTPATLQQLVAKGTIRFFYLPATRSDAGLQRRAFTGAAQPGGSQGRTLAGTGQGAASQNLASVNNDLTSWVETACKAVPTQLWQTTSSSTTNAQRGPGAGGGLQLYDCAAQQR